MNDHQARIARLQAEIAQLETELTGLEAEMLDLEREMGDFIERYDRLVRPIAEKLAVIHQMIAELEHDQAPPPPQLGKPPPPPPAEEVWTPPPDYVPVEEQYRRAWEIPRQQAAAQPPPDAPTMRPSSGTGDSESDLRKLYRQLARRYHPDLTTDPEERQRRNRLMAEINEAYSQRDEGALQALAAQPDTPPTGQPLAAIQVQQLEQIRAQLDRRLYYLRKQRNELLHGEMMDLKLQASFAAREGRDLLGEMAAEMQREYTICLDRLDQLRGS